MTAVATAVPLVQLRPSPLLSTQAAAAAAAAAMTSIATSSWYSGPTAAPAHCRDALQLLQRLHYVRPLDVLHLYGRTCCHLVQLPN
jgi:hypothetical protein